MGEQRFVISDDVWSQVGPLLLGKQGDNGARAIIPAMANRQVARDYDEHAYKWRHRIENFFAKI